MPTLHIIHGFLGSGKTTFAKKLEEKCKGVRLSNDAWMVGLFGPMPTEEEFKKHDTLEDLQYQLAARLLALNIDVILDHGFWSRKSRDRARALAAQHKATPKLYYLSAPEETMKMRAVGRKPDAETFFIDANAFEVLKKRFEPLGDDEPHELIKT